MSGNVIPHTPSLTLFQEREKGHRVGTRCGRSAHPSSHLARGEGGEVKRTEGRAGARGREEPLDKEKHFTPLTSA